MIRVGTRASALARTQSAAVARAITAATGEPCELVDVRTPGDRSSAPLVDLVRSSPAPGVFVSSLREALLGEEVDVAVHSLKDLPTAPADGIDLAAVPEREDARDALVSRGGLLLRDLPSGALVGTGSPRRAAMLAALSLRYSLDIEIVDLRGNVDTRIARVEHDLHAVVLALAGLRRLGREADVAEVLEVADMLPCPGQGALAVETRADEALTGQLRTGLDHPASRAAVTAERALLAVLDAGCSAPVGAFAVLDPVDPGLLVLDGAIGTGRGEIVRVRRPGPVADAAAVGRATGEELLYAAGISTGTTATISTARPHDTHQPVSPEESVR